MKLEEYKTFYLVSVQKKENWEIQITKESSAKISMSIIKIQSNVRHLAEKEDHSLLGSNHQEDLVSTMSYYSPTTSWENHFFRKGKRVTRLNTSLKIMASARANANWQLELIKDVQHQGKII